VALAVGVRTLDAPTPRLARMADTVDASDVVVAGIEPSMRGN
jgi:hypothetical protein